jgi:hypothetical protein
MADDEAKAKAEKLAAAKKRVSCSDQGRAGPSTIAGFSNIYTNMTTLL